MVKPWGSSSCFQTWWGPEQDSSNQIKHKINRALVSLSRSSMDKELQPIPRSRPRLMEQQMTLPNSELQQRSYLLVSAAKGTQDYSRHLNCFWTTVLPATASDITWEFSSDMTSTALFSPLWFPVALVHDPTRYSSPLTRFQSCLQIFRYSILILRNFWECRMAAERADRHCRVLVRSFLTPWCPVTELCCHHGLWKLQFRHPCLWVAFKAQPFWLETWFTCIIGIKRRGSHFITASIWAPGFPREPLAFCMRFAQRWLWSEVTLCWVAFNVLRTKNFLTHYFLLQK